MTNPLEKYIFSRKRFHLVSNGVWKEETAETTMDNMQGGLRLPKAILRQTKAIHRKSIFEARGKPNPFLRSGLEWREKSLWENCRGSWSREASHPDCQVAPGAPATGRQSTFSLSRFPAQIHAKIDTQIHVQIQIWKHTYANTNTNLKFGFHLCF